MRIMQNYFNALRFIIGCQFPGHKNIDVSNIVLPIDGDFLNAFVYQKVDGKPRGTILAVHGMSVMGNRDPRFVNVCKALAHCGYVVVSPLYPEIEEFLIKLETVDAIAKTIQCLTENHALCPSGKISIFSASFSAGMSIIAATQPETRELVRSICAVGTYCNAETSVNFLLGRQDNDEYGRFIILRNFIHHSIGLSDDLSEALRVAILDNGHCRENPELPALLSTMPDDVQLMFTRLRTDASYRRHHWKMACSPSHGVGDILKRLSALSTISYMRAAVALVHGADDRVIPSSESVILHRRLRESNKRSRLSLTPVISHGDVAITVSMIPALFNLTGTFAFFFRHA
jgi:pimeloyl-ACP methyl ester carboxylesterase